MLVDTYYPLGRSKDVIRHGVRGIELMPVMQFIDRGLMFPYCGGDGELYTATVDALSGQPNGQARIAALNAILDATIVAPRALIALDSAFVKQANDYQTQFKILKVANTMLGRVGYPIISNYWINRPSSDSADMPVNDGKIRILAFGFYS